MADYWKSNPRYFCEVCKCWFGDNKISIEFHQSGRRHKANVERQLRESRKRASVKEKEAIKLSETMEQIEKAAMESYQRDQMGLPPSKRAALATTGQVSKTPEIISFEQQNIRKEMAKKLEQKKKELDKEEEEKKRTASSPWQQLMSPEGYPYYYNSLTGVSQWEQPSDYSLSYSGQELVTATAATGATVTQYSDGSGTSVGAAKSNDQSSEHGNQSTELGNQSSDQSNEAKSHPSDLPSSTVPAAPYEATPYGATPYGATPYGATPYGAWTTVSLSRSEQTHNTVNKEDETAAVSSEEEEEEDCLSDKEENTFQEKTTPTTSTFGNVTIGSFKGFGFKKKQNRGNIKERTSDW